MDTCGYLWGLPVLICMVVCIFCFFLHLLACINTSIVYHLCNILHLVYVPCRVKIVVHFCEHPDDLMLYASLWSVDAWFAATVVAILAKLMHFPMAVQFICSVHFLLLQARMLQCPRVKTRSGCRRGYVSCCQEMVQDGSGMRKVAWWTPVCTVVTCLYNFCTVGWAQTVVMHSTIFLESTDAIDGDGRS